MKLGRKDYAILKALDGNARSSLVELGRAARMSKSAVPNHIAKLEKKGYISGYYAVIDSSRLGYLSFRVYLKFVRTTPKVEGQMLSFLMKDKRVWWLGKLQGPFDAGFVVWVPDLTDFRKFWMEILASFRPHIGKHVICPYVRLRHFTLSNLGDRSEIPKEAGVAGGGNIVELDEVDGKVLKVISENARDTLIEIGKKSGLHPPVVKYRLKRMMKSGVIQGFRAGINAAKLGYSLYKIDIYLDDLSKLPELVEFAKNQPSLAYIDETIGSGDFEGGFNLKSEQEMEELLGKFKARFQSAIREIDYMVYSKVLKYSYFPD